MTSSTNNTGNADNTGADSNGGDTPQATTADQDDQTPMTPGRWMRAAAYRRHVLMREYAAGLGDTAREGVSDEDYATTMATIEQMARNLGWDESQGEPGWSPRGPWGSRGWGSRGHGSRGHGSPGHGGCGGGRSGHRHGRGSKAESKAEAKAESKAESKAQKKAAKKASQSAT